MFDILFAGTGASIPSSSRSLPCIAVKQGKTITLFDCGEGAQRQLMLSPFSFMKVDRIFISHMHGDHFLGLPGLLQTMGMSGRKETVSVFGPNGIRKSVEGLLDSCEGGLEFELEITEVESGDVFDFGSFSVSVYATEHNCSSAGYLYREASRPGVFNVRKATELGLKPGIEFSKIQNGETVKGVKPEQILGAERPGCSLAYPGDTVVCGSVKEAITGVDVLIHESTYVSKDSDLAKEHFHSAAKDVASMAKDAGVGTLMIVHASNRYDDGGEVVSEAEKYFPNVMMPSDFDVYNVSPNGVKIVRNKISP